MNVYCDTDRYVKEIIADQEYDFLFKNLVIMDVGCNTGTFSLWLYGMAKQIYAIDIAEENINNLKQTIEDNKLTKISPYLLGIAGENGQRHVLKQGGAGLGGWQLSNDAGDMPVLTISKFMEQENIKHIDILKIDVEGSELEVVEAKDFPADKISLILGEIHFDLQDVRDRFKARLEELGYRYTMYLNNKFIARK